MAVEKIPARDWVFEVDDGAAGFNAIGGIETFGLTRSKTKADTTDFDSNGFNEHMVMRRGTEISLEGNYLEDPTTAARNAGQERVETLTDIVGTGSIVPFRITSPGGKVWTFQASVDGGPTGGGTDEETGWSCSVEVSGQVTKT